MSIFIDKLKISLVYQDNTLLAVQKQDISTNGYFIMDGLFFIYPDPQVIFTPSKTKGVKAVRMEGVCYIELPDETVRSMTARLEEFAFLRGLKSLAGTILRRFGYKR